MVIERIKSSFRRLQWKLTLSYSAVTVGSLFVCRGIVVDLTGLQMDVEGAMVVANGM